MFKALTEHGTPAHADAAAGRRVQAILDGIYRSSAEGREVEV
jgi:predicted dehydrogenase